MGRWGCGRAQLAIKVKTPWAATGLAVPGGEESGIAKAQHPPSRDLTRCLSSLSPRRLVAVISGGTARIWARFRLHIGVNACTACVSLCSPVCVFAFLQGKPAELLLQQKLLPSCELALAVVGGEQMGCQKKKKKSACLETSLQLPPQNG